MGRYHRQVFLESTVLYGPPVESSRQARLSVLLITAVSFQKVHTQLWKGSRVKFGESKVQPVKPLNLSTFFWSRLG